MHRTKPAIFVAVVIAMSILVTLIWQKSNMKADNRQRSVAHPAKITDLNNESPNAGMSYLDAGDVDPNIQPRAPFPVLKAH